MMGDQDMEANQQDAKQEISTSYYIARFLAADYESASAALVAHGFSEWETWEAIPEYFDTEAEAQEFADDMNRALAPRKLVWAVFTVSHPGVGTTKH
jgi:hypothetical protein